MITIQSDNKLCPCCIYGTERRPAFQPECSFQPIFLLRSSANLVITGGTGTAHNITIFIKQLLIQLPLLFVVYLLFCCHMRLRDLVMWNRGSSVLFERSWLFGIGINIINVGELCSFRKKIWAAPRRSDNGLFGLFQSACLLSKTSLPLCSQ